MKVVSDLAIEAKAITAWSNATIDYATIGIITGNDDGAYQPDQLWNGQFGATHLNEGTSSYGQLVLR